MKIDFLPKMKFRLRGKEFQIIHIVLEKNKLILIIFRNRSSCWYLNKHLESLIQLICPIEISRMYQFGNSFVSLPHCQPTFPDYMSEYQLEELQPPRPFFLCYSDRV